MRTGWWVLVLLCGCETVRGRPFTNSSVDFNDGRRHGLRTPGNVETVAEAVVSVMEDSGTRLVKRRDQKSGAVVLAFKATAERATGASSVSTSIYVPPTRWFRAGTFSSEGASRTTYVAYGGHFYVEVRPRDGGIEVTAIGLPVIDGLTACPEEVERYRACKPTRAPMGHSFATEVREQTGIDVRGRKEADILSGLMAQLQRKRWQDPSLTT